MPSTSASIPSVHLPATLDGDAPIASLVDNVLTQAITDRASDIHFEPYEHEFRIRYRIDGVLYELSPPPLHLAVSVISRIKVLADLNIAERKVPQDGRIRMQVAGRAVDLRVSTLPTQSGESVVLRVLDKGVASFGIEQLGMPEALVTQVREVASHPEGIVIVTGPTGSGKTTTLYSILRELNTDALKILTVEDPVEYEIEGIMQVSMKHEIGMTFDKVLRSFLRHDPDVIMVGEIRDLETAQTAVQASLTGHLVLSTLHTNDSVGAVTRLLDMGVEPYLLAATLENVLAQRLVRRICPHCRSNYLPTPQQMALLGLHSSSMEANPVYRGNGCIACNQSGYRGRTGLFEFLSISPGIREEITERASEMALRHTALQEGLRTLRMDGMRALFEGVTTCDEVLKCT
ncbi:MAG: GspE/PulE family protein [Verrucomicrobiota bacterium]|nr:GspE/PulE family protein [Verrucomicrobiota bacterium]